MFDEESIRALVWTTLRDIDIDRPGKKNKGEPPRVIEPLAVTSRVVSEVLDASIAVGDRVPGTASLPHALSGYDGRTDRLVLVRNGLLDLATRRLHPPTPRVFATAGAAVDFDATATCPTFERFLVEIFTEVESGVADIETIRLVRQIFGWLVAGDTTHHKIPLFVGQRRSGKSTLASLLRTLLGEGNVCGPPLMSLGESRFGLAPLLGKSLAIYPDARLGSRADQAAIAGILLAVSGGDTLTIDRKNRDAVEARLRCRQLIVSNELPRLADSSGALAGRWLIVETRRSFYGREDLTLESKLRAELPGILNWALDGWDDLQAHGWTQPTRATEIVEDLERLGSPIKAFIADRLVVGEGIETELTLLYREWRLWCEDVGRKEPGTTETFGRDLHAAMPSGVATSRRRDPRQPTRRMTMYVARNSGEIMIARTYVLLDRAGSRSNGSRLLIDGSFLNGGCDALDHDPARSSTGSTARTSPHRGTPAWCALQARIAAVYADRHSDVDAGQAGSSRSKSAKSNGTKSSAPVRSSKEHAASADIAAATGQAVSPC